MPMAKRWYDMMQAGKSAEATMDLVTDVRAGQVPEGDQYIPGTPGYIATWHGIIQAAEDANEPGKFTAFIGYEWTSLVKGNNLHRNVIFRDNGDKAQPGRTVHQLRARELQPARPVEVDDRPTKARPAARCWRSRTTATSATG